MALSFGSLIFIALAIICATGNALLMRFVLKKTDPYAFALLTQIGGIIILLPFAVREFSAPAGFIPWVVVFGAAIIWTMFSFSIANAYKKAEVSVNKSIEQSKLIIILILGIFFLGELADFQRIIGTIVIAAGIFFLVWHPQKRFAKIADPGVRWAFLAAVLVSFATILDKTALRWFSPGTYGFLAYLIPGVIFLMFLPRKMGDFKHLLKTHWFAAPVAVAFGILFYYFSLRAYAVTDITLVFPLLQLSTLVAVLAGIIFLKEREHLWQKIIAAIIVVVGTIIIGN